MFSFLRPWFDVNGDEAVVLATSAKAAQLERADALAAQKAQLEAAVAESGKQGEKFRRAVQERLAERARLAEPALDAYDAVSMGKILYDQLAQLLAKIHDGIYQAAAADLRNYGYRSKQFFSTGIAADVLQRHFRAWPGGAEFDSLLVPLMDEMHDAGSDPAALAPLLEFAHEGCFPNARLNASVHALKENVARHRRHVGAYSSGARVEWESVFDLLKFSVRSSVADVAKAGTAAALASPATAVPPATPAAAAAAASELSLVERADDCAERIEAAVRRGHWAACVAGVGELWTILAPTIRAHSDDTDANVPLLASLFDIRAAAEQHLAAEYFDQYARATAARHQTAFTMRLFDMEQQQQRGGAGDQTHAQQNPDGSPIH